MDGQIKNVKKEYKHSKINTESFLPHNFLKKSFDPINFNTETLS